MGVCGAIEGVAAMCGDAERDEAEKELVQAEVGPWVC